MMMLEAKQRESKALSVKYIQKKVSKVYSFGYMFEIRRHLPKLAGARLVVAANV